MISDTSYAKLDSLDGLDSLYDNLSTEKLERLYKEDNS